jgi:hypothetical protein
MLPNPTAKPIEAIRKPKRLLQFCAAANLPPADVHAIQDLNFERAP